MDFRKTYENKLISEIKKLHIYNKNDEEFIYRIRDTKADDFNKIKINKAKENMINRNKEIEIMENEILLTKDGLNDDKIKEDIQKTTQLFKDKYNTHINKVNKIKEENTNENNKIKGKIKQDRKENYAIKNNFKEMDRMYKTYQYFASTIPNYLINNLYNMPCNQGYIWKDIYMYGKLPAIPNKPIVLEEKISKEKTIIHEWFNGKFKKYEKPYYEKPYYKNRY